MKLTYIYGDWSWTTADDYKKQCAALRRVTIDTELKMDPSTSRTTKAEFMSEDQLNALLDYVWEEAEKAQKIAEKLMHFICYFIISLLLFSCLCGRDEISFCRVDEITQVDEDTLLFQMKRDYKSHKLDAQMNIIHKPSRVLLGRRLGPIFAALKINVSLATTLIGFF